MNRSKTAKLITETYTKNDYGVLERSLTEKKVYVDVNSVSSSEWFEGGRNGLNPELRFTMFRYDYNNEKLIEYEGSIYTIYRTYIRNGDEIELYCEKRKGNE